MISGFVAVAFFLASGSENHEQEFNHHRRDPCHYPQLLLAHLFVQDSLADFPAGSCDRIGQTQYLGGAVSFSVFNL